MPVYVCFRGDCDNLAFEEGSPVFLAHDALGREWKCAENRYLQRGEATKGSAVKMRECPDQVSLRWHLIQDSYPLWTETADRLQLAGWGFHQLDYVQGRTYNLTLCNGREVFTVHGSSENEVWHFAAQKAPGLAPGEEKTAMNDPLTFAPQSVPLYRDKDGDIRIADTRILLDVVLDQYKAGTDARGIVDNYPQLALADVYAVLAYYHRNQEAIDEYCRVRDEEGERLRQEIEARQGSSSEWWAETRQRWEQRGKDHALSVK